MKGIQKVEVFEAFFAATKAVFPKLQDMFDFTQTVASRSMETTTEPTLPFQKLVRDIAHDPNVRVTDAKAISGADVLRGAVGDDSGSENIGGDGNSSYGHGVTPAMSPAKSSHTDVGMADGIYVDEDLRTRNFRGQDAASSWTAINKHGKRGSEDGGKGHELDFEDGMKKLKVTDTRPEGLTKGTKTLKRKSSKPIFAEGQENEDFKARLMAQSTWM